MAQLTKKITDLTAIEGINGENLLIIDDGSETCKITANELAEYINGKSSAQPNVQSDWNETDAESDAYIKNKPSALAASDVYEWAKAQTKPAYTAAEVGADQSGSAAIALASSKKYTDDRITQLIGTSPENLDTIEELGAAISQNQSAIDAIENAITNKADSDHDHDELYAAKSSEHTHGNKEVLDAITADIINKKIYNSPSQIDPSYDYTNFSYMMLPVGSVLLCSVNSNSKSLAFQSGLIPTESVGVIFALNAASRGFVLFVTSDKMYFAFSNNLNASPLSSWEVVVNKSSMLATYSDLMANTASGYLPDALAVKKGFDMLGGLKFAVVSALPSDAASHTDTVYIVTG